jgi:hypothetical protein
MAPQRIVKRLLEPLVIVGAALYFLIDALVLSIIRPLLRRISRLPIFQFIGSWIASLGPFTTLTLFVVPVLVLEPVKPVGVYLIATGHPVSGVLIIAIGEVLKVTIVERIFHIGRDKLMRITLFAWAYNVVVGWLDWLQALPPWQATKRHFRAMVRWAHNLTHHRASRPF